MNLTAKNFILSIVTFITSLIRKPSASLLQVAFS